MTWVMEARQRARLKLDNLTNVLVVSTGSYEIQALVYHGYTYVGRVALGISTRRECEQAVLDFRKKVMEDYAFCEELHMACLL